MTDKKTNTTSIPFTCPTCNGNGVILDDFYALKNNETTTNVAINKCATCNGTGIIVYMKTK